MGIQVDSPVAPLVDEPQLCLLQVLQRPEALQAVHQPAGNDGRSRERAAPPLGQLRRIEHRPRRICNRDLVRQSHIDGVALQEAQCPERPQAHEAVPRAFLGLGVIEETAPLLLVLSPGQHRQPHGAAADHLPEQDGLPVEPVVQVIVVPQAHL